MSPFDHIIGHCHFPSNEQAFTEAQRLFHGRGHAYQGLNHVTIDWLPPVLLITLFAAESELIIEQLCQKLLTEIPNCKSIQLQHRYQLHGPIDVIWGDDFSHLTVKENGNKYKIQLGKSRNTGLFLDIKNGRQWIQDHCKNKRVLNLFSYTCGFSVAAIEGGAKSVLNVDMSSPALNVGRENHRLNEHSLQSVSFEKINIFKSFGRLKKRGPFDILICDPPTFQKGSVDIERDYPKIMRRLKEFMAPQSTLLLCLNSPDLGKGFIVKNMFEHAPQYTYINEVKPPKVYVDAENKGLKVLVFQEKNTNLR